MFTLALFNIPDAPTLYICSTTGKRVEQSVVFTVFALLWVRFRCLISVTSALYIHFFWATTVKKTPIKSDCVYFSCCCCCFFSSTHVGILVYGVWAKGLQLYWIKFAQWIERIFRSVFFCSSCHITCVNSRGIQYNIRVWTTKSCKMNRKFDTQKSEEMKCSYRFTLAHFRREKTQHWKWSTKIK